MGVSSGLGWHFNFNRSPDHFNKIFIMPSIILVVFAYITFWIDYKKAAERTIFIVINILN